ncbi:MAG: hypothetical protein K0S04_1647 [Herbinix sp.]|nr:hypothetical protein [Herbinix sp.]
MANEKEGQALREYGIRKKRLRRRRRIVLVTLLLLIIAAGLVGYSYISLKKYNDYKLVKKTEITGVNAVGYIAFDQGIVKYSKDGAVAISKNGTQLWNGAYEMADPIADSCKNYVVIADRAGKSIYIYNEDGEVGNIPTVNDIQTVEVGQQGVVAVLTESKKGNQIILYDKDGTELAPIETTVSSQGYPLDISISDDAQKLVTSYLSFTEGSLTDMVSCYNFGEVGKNMTDRFAGGFKFDEGIIVPKVEFVNNDTICAYKDNGFVIYSMEELPKSVHEEKLEGKIQSVMHNEQYIGVVIQQDGANDKQLLLYDLKGNKVLERDVDFNYETIYLTEKELIMYNNTSCIIMKLSGVVKFKYTFEESIEGIYPINYFDRYYLMTGKDILEIRLN